MALQSGQPRAAEPLDPTAKLNAREVQIIKTLQEGKRNREIAAALHLREKTVKRYMMTFMQKLNARSRLELAAALKEQAD